LHSENTFPKHNHHQQKQQQNWSRRNVSGSASSPSLSIWRRKKEMGKEGLIVATEVCRKGETKSGMHEVDKEEREMKMKEKQSSGNL
jgi:hypothetical protein